MSASLESTSARLGVTVLHDGPGELVLDKPAGMASEVSDDHKGASLLERVRRALELPDARLPHRLDRVTSGLLLVAKDKKSAAWHGEQIREGSWQKLYLARVHLEGASADLLGEHSAYLKRVKGRAVSVRAGGRPSSLRVVSIETIPDRPAEAHVLVHLLTGRFHQVRVMLSDLGAPLVGDTLYGGGEGEPFLQHVRLSFRPQGGSGIVTLMAPVSSEVMTPELRELLLSHDAR